MRSLSYSKGSAGSGKCFRTEQSWVLTSPTWRPALRHLPELLPAVLQEWLILPWHGQSILVVAFSPYFLWFHNRLGFLKENLLLHSAGNGHPHPRAGVKHGVIPLFSLSMFYHCVCQSRLWLSLWKSSIISFVLISFPSLSTCLPVFFHYSGSPPDRNLREQGCVTSIGQASHLSSLLSAWSPSYHCYTTVRLFGATSKSETDAIQSPELVSTNWAESTSTDTSVSPTREMFGTALWFPGTEGNWALGDVTDRMRSRGRAFVSRELKHPSESEISCENWLLNAIKENKCCNWFASSVSDIS